MKEAHRICRRSARGWRGAAAAVALLAASAAAGGAAVKMPHIFGDHMVLQQEVDLPVWGTAAPGEQIVVSFAGRTASATADAAGNWLVKLPPSPGGGEAAELNVTGSNQLTFHDVLVGDVWLCSGQSNMEFGVGRSQNGSEAIAKADNPQLRLFTVHGSVSFTPLNDCQGEWLVCTPENVKKNGWGGFSAIGYFFGDEIQRARKIPVGLIHASWGGTPAQAWTEPAAMHAQPALSHYAEEVKLVRDTLPQLKADYDANILPAWQQADADWRKKYGVALKQAEQTWQADCAKAAKENRPPPPKPQPEKPEPKKPVFAGQDPYQPGVLFNGMINPLLRFGIKGAIWYQGESNAHSKESCAEYATLFPALITDWRTRWSEGIPSLSAFPFFYVQLASWGGGWAYPLLRESQAKALSLPNTGMAVALDLGEENNIHPKDKQDVGHRLALLARHRVYHEEVADTGPVFESIKAENDRLRVTFREIAGGLVVRAPPVVPLGLTANEPGKEVQGFTIAGSDGRLVPARAEIEGESVVVWSDAVTRPVEVGYGWAPFPKPPVNLYNKAGLPACPFRASVGR